MKNQDFRLLFELYKNYYKTLNIYKGLDTGIVPYVSTQEEYTIIDTYHKYSRFFEDVIKQNVFDTPESQKLFDLINTDLASIKSILTHITTITNPYIVQGSLLNNLLYSFGFPILAFPDFVKRQLLLHLVENYKIKGTKQSLENILEIILPRDVDVSELWFKKIINDPYFSYTYKIDIPGHFSFRERDINPFPIIHKDRHWWISDSELASWEINKAMTPYFIVNGYISAYENMADIILLRTYAARDYQVLLTGTSQDYQNTKDIVISSLPLKINYLELYELIRYIYLKKYFLTGTVHDDPNLQTYSYNPPNEDYDIIIDEIQKQFQTRYSNPFGTIESETKNCSIDTIIKTLGAFNLPFQAENYYTMLPDLNDTGCTLWRNKIIVLGGYDPNTLNYNSNMYIIDLKSKQTFSVNIGIQLKNPIVVSSKSCKYICVTGGYNPDGSKNYNVWQINLTNFSVMQIPSITEDLWMEDPLVVQSNDVNFIISRSESDTCPGGIYIWNICSGYKQIVAQFDITKYDITTIRACSDSKNRLYIFLKTKFLSSSYRIVYLDLDPKYEIFTDITCLIQQQSAESIYIHESLNSGNFFYYGLGDSCYIVTQGPNYDFVFVRLKVTYTDYNYKRKLAPRRKYIYGPLIPARSCLMCPSYTNSILEVNCQNLFTNIYKTEIDSVENYFGYHFVHIKRTSDGQVYTYWPLIKSVYTMCCNSKTARIGNFLPPYMMYDILPITPQYDSHSYPYGYLSDCYFYFMYIDTINKIVGIHENVDDYTFEPIFKLGQTSSTLCGFYDTSSDYDVIQVDLRCYSTYPDSLFSDDSDYMVVYENRQIPEIVVLGTFLRLYSLFQEFGPQEIFYNYDYHLQNLSVILHTNYGSNTLIHEIVLFPKIVSYIFHDCEFTYTPNEDYARDFRKSMLIERQDKLVSNNNVLPMFNSFSDLEDFLTNVTYENKITIDSSGDIDKIFFELLTIASSLYPGADLTLLFPESSKLLQPIIDMFKPVHSRNVGFTQMFLVPDPVGDWVTFEDSIEFFKVKNLVSWLMLYDCTEKHITKKLFDILNLSDLITSNILKEFTDNLILWEDLHKVVTERFTEINYYKSLYDDSEIYDERIKILSDRFEISTSLTFSDRINIESRQFDEGLQFDIPLNQLVSTDIKQHVTLKLFETLVLTDNVQVNTS